MTKRRALVPAAVVAAALATAAASTAGTRATPKLVGEVGPGFTIEVTNAADKDVKKLKAGSYTIKVEDKSNIHNFHLMGPGVNKKTGVSFKGTQSWTVELKAGTYTYQCDPHAASGMKGTFKVTM
jgi:plastocyanin